MTIGKLNCAKCGHDVSRVVDSRVYTKKFGGVIRRRKCARCKFAYSTCEIHKELFELLTGSGDLDYPDS